MSEEQSPPEDPTGLDIPISEELQKQQPLLVLKKVRQYTSNLCGSTPPISIAGPSLLLSLQERETQQYTSPFVLHYASHLYGSTPPICTAVRLPFVRQYASRFHVGTFEKVLGAGVTGKFLTIERDAARQIAQRHLN